MSSKTFQQETNIPSPARSLFIIGSSVFVAEAAIMYVLHLTPSLSFFMEGEMFDFQ